METVCRSVLVGYSQQRRQYYSVKARRLFIARSLIKTISILRPAGSSVRCLYFKFKRHATVTLFWAWARDLGNRPALRKGYGCLLPYRRNCTRHLGILYADSSIPHPGRVRGQRVLYPSCSLVNRTPASMLSYSAVHSPGQALQSYQHGQYHVECEDVSGALVPRRLRGRTLSLAHTTAD